MTHPARVLLWIAVGIFSARPAAAAAGDEGVWDTEADGIYESSREAWAVDESRSCGPRCLTFVLRYAFDTFASYKLVTDLIDVGEQGTTLADLKAAAEQHGVHASAFHGGVTDLQRAVVPCIVALRRDDRTHFIVSLGWVDSKKMFLVYDGGPGLGGLRLDGMKRAFTGDFLAISRDPIEDAPSLFRKSSSEDRAGPMVLAGALILQAALLTCWIRRRCPDAARSQPAPA